MLAVRNEQRANKGLPEVAPESIGSVSENGNDFEGSTRATGVLAKGSSCIDLATGAEVPILWRLN